MSTAEERAKIREVAEKFRRSDYPMTANICADYCLELLAELEAAEAEDFAVERLQDRIAALEAALETAKGAANCPTACIACADLLRIAIAKTESDLLNGEAKP